MLTSTEKSIAHALAHMQSAGIEILRVAEHFATYVMTVLVHGPIFLVCSVFKGLNILKYRPVLSCRNHFVNFFFFRYLCISGPATDWSVRVSNHGGSEVFRNRLDCPWGPPSLLCNEYRLIPGRNASGLWR